MDGVSDILVVGAGSAGLSAGVYGARSRRSTLILDRKRPGGQAATTEKMENYPGFPECIGGRTLMDRFRDHATGMGAKIEKTDVVGFAEEGGIYIVKTADGGVRKARSLILAPGCEPRRLGIPGEKEFSGSGVSYCATCDAELYEGATVVVVGSGDTAVEEANYISRFADEVVMIVVHDEGVLDCNKTMAETALANPKMTWKWNRSLASIEGTDSVTGVKAKNLRSGGEETIACDGVFIFVGTVPQTAFIGDFVAMRNGFIVTDEKMETNRPLVYAVGDARVKALRQVVTAASDGAIAAFFADRALTEMDEFAAAIGRAGRDCLLYFYTPPVQKSLELFPVVERMAGDLGLPLVKLDTFRYRGVASRLGVTVVPRLLHVTTSDTGDVIPGETIPLEI
jgi:thioredoxin reductase (NADPH)